MAQRTVTNLTLIKLTLTKKNINDPEPGQFFHLIYDIL